MWVDVDGLNYHVEIDEQVGDLKGRRPLSMLLLHGFTGSARSWDALVPDLTAARRVIRVDLPGHGQTAHTDDLARYTMPRVADDLARLLTSLNAAPADVCGYSMGARLALYLGAHHPDVVRALLIESGSPGLATEAERAVRITSDYALADRIERDGIAAFVREWEALPLWATQTGLPDAAKAAQRAIRLANRPSGLALSLRGMGTGAQPSLWDALADLRMPVHCLVGALDVKFCAIASDMRARNPAIAVEIVSGAGHAVHLEAPDRYVGWHVKAATSP
jgi:2-succinyl-6-hydroxy-2,4-cyclohexadiene-1-carboxylate synthase